MRPTISASLIIQCAATALTVALLLGISSMASAAKLITVDASVPQNFPDDGFSHDEFEQLLRKYVDSDGNVDYDTWHATEDDVAKIDSYLAAVTAFSPENAPERFAGRNDRLAYWMYAYNAYVIKAILLRWPLNSVTDVRAPFEFAKGYGFFYRQRFLFGEESYSLYAVENDKIRDQFKDPRIHFVLNCGSESCPILRPELPTGNELEPFLQYSAVQFVSEPRNVHVDHAKKRIVLSDIFKLFKKDFINDLRRRGLPSDHGLIDYIVTLAPEPLRTELQESTDYKVVFEEYNWSINKAPAGT